MARFFFAGAQSGGSAELKELLLRRYGNLDFVDDMDVDEFIEFVTLARKKDHEERIRQQWLAMLPKMTKYVNYHDFEDMITGKNIDQRSDADILSELASLHGEEALNGIGNI